MPPTPEYAIYDTVFGYAKIYPDVTKLFLYDKPIRVRISGYEERDPKAVKQRKSPFEDPMTIIDSLRRTKTRLSDIVISNKFDMFCTFTFNCKPCPKNRNGEKCTNNPRCICDEDTCTRKDVAFEKKRMSTWLNHQQKRVGKFDYLIVPEYHHDQKAIHFHALFKGYKGKLIDTGHKTKRGKISYVLQSYSLGYSTIVLIPNDEIEHVGKYVRKYITKDMPQFNGKKRYWCSHNLIRPKKIKNPILFPSQMEKFTEEHQMQNMAVKIARERVDLTSSDYPGKNFEL